MSEWLSESSLIHRGIIVSPPVKTDPAASFVPRRLLLQWHITDRCNLRCSHCYQDDGSAAEMAPAVMDSVFDQYLAMLTAMGIDGHMNITGGEPMLHEGLFPLLERIYDERARMGFGMLTNGILVDDAAARELARLGCRFVQVSLEGGCQTNDAIRGAGTFDAVGEAIRRLRRAGLQTLVSFTAHKGNLREFDAVVRAARRAGASMVWADRMIPAGRGACGGAAIMDEGEVMGLFEDMYAARRRSRRLFGGGPAIPLHRALQFLALAAHGERDYTPYRCNAGRGLVTIMPEGTVLPCRRMPVAVGNVRRRSLHHIYRSSALLRALRRPGEPPAACRDCAHGPSCRGGLRCLSFALTGSPFNRDPQCFRGRRIVP